MTLLKINNLKAKIGNKSILKGVNFNINLGEVHVVMGPNGAGKSTLASVIAGKSGYEIEGEIYFLEKNLLEMSPEIRAREGLFLSFQNPMEIPGLSNITFIKTAINEKRKHNGLETIDALDFKELIESKSNLVKMDLNFLNRSVNDGFSGGEKKRNEIFQLAMLEPKLAILDEIDSGLDVDALRIVADSINNIKMKESSFLIITHYQRLLNYIIPDYIHILVDGKIIKSGDSSLAKEIETKGYDSF